MKMAFFDQSFPSIVERGRSLYTPFVLKDKFHRPRKGLSCLAEEFFTLDRNGGKLMSRSCTLALDVFVFVCPFASRTCFALDVEG